nr:retrovirus-related Pol polyprotein from transposon TNT 1-94 [Tanacetum cinerariifolium]
MSSGCLAQYGDGDGKNSSEHEGANYEKEYCAEGWFIGYKYKGDKAGYVGRKDTNEADYSDEESSNGDFVKKEVNQDYTEDKAVYCDKRAYGCILGLEIFVFLGYSCGDNHVNELGLLCNTFERITTSGEHYLDVERISCTVFRGARKLKRGSLYLYVGNGMRAEVEAIRSFDLHLPNGLIIVLDNCHYAPTIPRGVVSVSRLVNKDFPIVL